MTVDEALAVFQALDAQAREGWPGGFDPIAVRRRAGDALQAITEAEAGVPTGQDRAAWARALLARVAGDDPLPTAPYRATVPPRTRVQGVRQGKA